MPVKCFYIIYLIFPGLFHNILHTADGLTWLKQPGNVTYAPHGCNKSIKWYYKTSNNETFLSSDLFVRSRRYASRYANDDTYGVLTEPVDHKVPITLYGKSNVTVIVFNATSVDHGEYCCVVTVRLKKGILLKELRKCTSLLTYSLPRIAYHTPNLSCKQGDSVKLQCNATGYPEPRVEWIHRDTKTIIANSSVSSLNITGKRSEGRYCCHVTNQFGNETNCTLVKVTEYAPVMTTLSKVDYVTRNKFLRITCNAISFPPPSYIFTQNEEEKCNSTDGKHISFVKNNTQNIVMSCIPWNKYGQGPMVKKILPVYEQPKFINELRNRYNMTTKGITVTCSATGNPKPNITWFKGQNGDIVSTNQYYNVPYVKCINNILSFYCRASNVVGSINSTEIKVYVMTKRNCSSRSAVKEVEHSNMDLLWVWVCTTTVFIVVVVAAFLFYLKRRVECDLCKDKTVTEESLYQEPIDAVLKPVNREIALNEDYATVEECCYTDKRNRLSKEKRKLPVIACGNNMQSGARGEEPTYEELVVDSNIPDMI